MGNNSGNFEDTEILKTGNKTTCNEEYFSLGFFHIDTPSCRETKFKRPLFKFEKNKKNDLDSRPYSSKTIIGRSFNFTLNFSSDIRLQLMFLEYHRKMNFKGSYAIFPKPSDIFTV